MKKETRDRSVSDWSSRGAFGAWKRYGRTKSISETMVPPFDLTSTAWIG